MQPYPQICWKKRNDELQEKGGVFNTLADGVACIGGAEGGKRRREGSRGHRVFASETGRTRRRLRRFYKADRAQSLENRRKPLCRTNAEKSNPVIQSRQKQ